MTQNIRRGTCFGCVCRSASVCQSKRGSLVRRRTNFHESDQSLLPPAKRPAMSEFGHSIYSSVWRQFYRSRCVGKVGFQAIRLSMITSEELLYVGRSKNPCFLSYLLSARDYSPLIHKCIYSDPNYGSCWFRAKLFPLGSTEEVLFRAIKFTAHEIAVVSNVYYDAMLGYAKRQCGMETQQNRKKRREIVGVRSVRFSYPFQPYQMVARQEPLTVGKKLKVLFGTSQIES